MKRTDASPESVAQVAARVVLGGMFVWLGAVKALDPVSFLKLVRQFELAPTGVLLNALAAVLPWLEIFCGGLLAGGERPRAAALVAIGLLVPFTTAVLWHAIVLFRGGGVAFCALRFDCGCGTGEVLVCGKLAQNAALVLLAGFVAFANSKRQEPAGRAMA